jgi:hypothetical protein
MERGLNALRRIEPIHFVGFVALLSPECSEFYSNALALDTV